MKFTNNTKNQLFLALAALTSTGVLSQTADAQVSTALPASPVLTYRCFGSIDGGGVLHPLLEGSKTLDRCREADGRISYATGCKIESAGIIGRLSQGGNFGLLAKFTNITNTSANICLVLAAALSADGEATVNGGHGSGVLGGNWYGCSNDATSIALGRRAYVTGNANSGMAYCDYQLDLGY